jgi:leucyl-tRNA synthetase
MTEKYDFRTIEAKWQQIWEEQRLFEVTERDDRPKFYGLEMFPYPSGAGLSVGHCKNYAPMDAFCRFKAMQGYNVLHPMGWDAFGQPAENEAIKRGRNPREMVPEYAANYRRTLKRIGASYDWSREINSSLPNYYRWTQWFFLLLYKRGLAYRADAPINWCPKCQTGLANEEVKEGLCWRCDTPVEKRPMPQWYFKITAYAQRLLDDLDTIRWSEGIKTMQREWIGRSEGAEIDFTLQNSSHKITVFTTRPDTLWGATFMVLAPEHPLVAEITTDAQRKNVDAYIARTRNTTDVDRLALDRKKTGEFTGAYAHNPVTGRSIPIWIADYVLMGYGTGAIMAVPAHDQRDFEFARQFGLDIEMVYTTPNGPQSPQEMDRAAPETGVMREFQPAGTAPKSPFAGQPNNKQTVKAVIEWMEQHNIARSRVNYKLRDWLISRQRYWGAPIPIIHCPRCGEVPVPDDQLPVTLPEVDSYQPSGTGESPLAGIPQFVGTTCPKCSSAARRETDTMGGFACSSWYFLRFADAHNPNAFASREKLDYWLPVDLYAGGAEHAVMHLLYARFWTKVMFDAGLVGFTEPFTELRNQGSMLAWTPGRKPRGGEQGGAEDGDSVVDWIVLKPEERDAYPQHEIVWRWARMSKSKGNVVTPDDICERFGADTLRMYEMFVAPYEENVQWNEDGVFGSHRFVQRVWRWCTAAVADYSPQWRQAPRTPDEHRPIRRKLHQTIAKVTADLEEFRFNTAIAALMELTNELYLWRPADRTEPLAEQDAVTSSEALETILLLLAPFAPHLADELLSRIGYTKSSYAGPWPVCDPAIAAEDVLTLVVQVNGKVRDKLEAPAGSDDDALRALALASPRVAEHLSGMQVRKVIVIPGKLVNIVAG